MYQRADCRVLQQNKTSSTAAGVKGTITQKLSVPKLRGYCLWPLVVAFSVKGNLSNFTVASSILFHTSVVSAIRCDYLSLNIWSSFERFRLLYLLQQSNQTTVCQVFLTCVTCSSFSCQKTWYILKYLSLDKFIQKWKIYSEKVLIRGKTIWNHWSPCIGFVYQLSHRVLIKFFQ